MKTFLLFFIFGSLDQNEIAKKETPAGDVVYIQTTPESWHFRILEALQRNLPLGYFELDQRFQKDPNDKKAPETQRERIASDLKNKRLSYVGYFRNFNQVLSNENVSFEQSLHSQLEREEELPGAVNDHAAIADLDQEIAEEPLSIQPERVREWRACLEKNLHLYFLNLNLPVLPCREFFPLGEIAFVKITNNLNRTNILMMLEDSLEVTESNTISYFQLSSVFWLFPSELNRIYWLILRKEILKANSSVEEVFIRTSERLFAILKSQFHPSEPQWMLRDKDLFCKNSLEAFGLTSLDENINLMKTWRDLCET